MDDRRPLADVYRAVRATTERLCAPLEADDFSLQATDDTSPPKWHLAHTSWFFETFVLRRFGRAYRPVDERYAILFNSYYESVGAQHPRPQRALLSRPTIGEVFDYRRRVDDAVLEALATTSDPDAAALVTLGLEHEQQHQELLLMDLRRSHYANPLRPAYRADLAEPPRAEAPPLSWIEIEGGLHHIGATPDAGFSYDNERPRHRVLLDDVALASRPVTGAEWIEFVAAGGYQRCELWLSDGWAWRQREAVTAPLYWEERDGSWWRFSLAGMRPVRPHAPVSHVSFYEADAFARWAGARLPTEAEWEVAATTAAATATGTLLEDDVLEPAPAAASGGLLQAIGDVWELTASPYAPYPGYAPPAGALGEYNGKFMCNQIVLRGGSCLTPRAHIRPSYRNFYYPHQRWNTQGLRLAR